jgi:hypothetical protein
MNYLEQVMNKYQPDQIKIDISNIAEMLIKIGDSKKPKNIDDVYQKKVICLRFIANWYELEYKEVENRLIDICKVSHDSSYLETYDITDYIVKTNNGIEFFIPPEVALVIILEFDNQIMHEVINVLKPYDLTEGAKNIGIINHEWKVSPEEYESESFLRKVFGEGKKKLPVMRLFIIYINN